MSLAIYSVQVKQMGNVSQMMHPLHIRYIYKGHKRGTKDTKGTVKLINLKQTDNAMAKNEKDKQTTAHVTQHRKLKNKQHEPHQKL